MNSTLEAALVSRFRDLIAQRLGLHFDDSQRDFLADVLHQRIASHGGNAEAYLQNLDQPAERDALAEELTVGETHFFRHPDQFRALTDVIQARPPGPLRILSAGCASGEEAYSLAILLREHGAASACISAIDVNPAALARAEQARYTAWSLRGVSAEVRQRYFRGDKMVELDESIRSRVAFTRCNLADAGDEFWRSEPFDVIFCRNVIMYFTSEAARAVVARLANALVPGGLLFLAPAESLRGLSHDFHLRHTHDTFYYQRRGAGEPPMEATLSPAPALDAAWVAAIGQSSERIARLSRALPGATATQPVSVHSARPDADAQILRAATLVNSGQVGEADELCRRILRGDELNAEAHYVLALCHAQRREYAAAMQSDETASYLDKEFAMPLLHLGLLRKRVGDKVGARQAFRQADALLPREQAGRILLFGDGFSRELLVKVCAAELRAAGEDA